MKELPDMYRYPAVFEEDEKNMYSISFPDLEGVFSCGDSIEDALYMAKDCLGGYLQYLEEKGKEIPKATTITKVKIPKLGFVHLIEVYMPPLRNDYDIKIERKNVSLPAWLNRLAKKNKINCSALLVAALKHELGL
jgi:predicted RNase H-like HicB family nuclease